MSLHKLTTGDGYAYLTQHVAGGDVDRVRGQDAGDYYTAEGNPPGYWIGRGAPLLGLDGAPASEEQMRALFRDGMHPDAGRIITDFLAANLTDGLSDRERAEVEAQAVRAAMLGRAYPRYQPLAPFEDRVTARLEELRELTARDPTRAEIAGIQAAEAKRARAAVAGYDLVFAPVKSAALLWALHPAAAAHDAVRDAHRTAMASALELLEEHAAFTRTGAGGVAQIDTHGLIGAAFDHYDSRDGDPNLHTHVVIANKVMGSDGVWRALDARGLYRIAVAASEHYNTVFQAALSESLGVTFTARYPSRGKEPVREVDGVPTALIEEFSRRSTALVACYEQLVAAYRDEHGHDPPVPVAHDLRRQATLATRQGKKQPRSLAAMRADWAEAAGPAAIEHLTRAVPALPPATTPATTHPTTAGPAAAGRPPADAAGDRLGVVVRDGPGPSRTDPAGTPVAPDRPVIVQDQPAIGPDQPDDQDQADDRDRSSTGRDRFGSRVRAAWRAAARALEPTTLPPPRPPGAPAPPDAGRGSAAGLPRWQVEALAALVTAAVAERRSTWTVWNLRAEAERLIRAQAGQPGSPQLSSGSGAGVLATVAGQRAAVEAVVAAATSPAYSICVEAPAMLNEPATLRRRRDGASVFVEHGAARYTSRTILDAEERLLAAARTHPATYRGTAPAGPSAPVPSPVPSPGAVDAALDSFETTRGSRLDEGQRALVAAFAADPRLLVVGIGAAGTGKTTAMRAYHHTLTTLSGITTVPGTGDRVRLVPLATSAASAAVLARELGVPAENLHKFLHEHLHGAHADVLAAGGPVPVSHEMFRLRAGDVVLVDEAGMAGTLNLDRVVSVAAAHGARVRLLGDYRQLAAVESGGALRLIATDVGAAELTTVHRFHSPEQAAATLKLRVGDHAALDYYQDHARIVGGSTSAMLEAAYTGWWADVRAGRTSFMPAATNQTVADLSARARADRVAAGDVEPDGVRLHDGNTAGVGDWIVTRANRRTLSMNGGRDWVRNGDPWRVLARGTDGVDEGSLHVEHLGHGGRVVLPASYVRAEVELLYATTAHRVQGGTVDTAHPLITDDLTREHLYVMVTRARDSTKLYVVTHDVLPFDEDERLDRTRWDPNAYAAREVLHTILDRDGAEPSATETIRRHQADAESLATLIPRYLHALQRLAGDLGDHTDARAADAGRPTADRPVGGRPSLVPLARPTSADAARYLVMVEHVLPRGIDPLTRTRVDHAAALATPLHLITPPENTPPDDHPPGDEASHEGVPMAPARHAGIVAYLYGGRSTAFGSALTGEPAWPALRAALRRAEHAGYDVVDLLREVAAPTDLHGAASTSEALAARVGTYLGDHPTPLHHPAGRHGASPTRAFQVLAWTLKGHETLGGRADDLLTGAEGALSLRDVLRHAQRRSRHLHTDHDYAAGPATGGPGASPGAGSSTGPDAGTRSGIGLETEPVAELPPWTPTPPGHDTRHVGRGDYAIGEELPDLARAYLDGAAAQIRDRIHHLTRDMLTDRPAWADVFGPAPADPPQRRQWTRQVGVVAAYREQHGVRDNDPARPLGPYLAPDQPGHTAYWHAAAAIVTARHLTQPHPLDGESDQAHGRPMTRPMQPPLLLLARPYNPVIHQVAVDVYNALPVAERDAIVTAIVAAAGNLWLGDPSDPDTAAVQPAYHRQLHDALTRRGHLTGTARAHAGDVDTPARRRLTQYADPTARTVGPGADLARPERPRPTRPGISPPPAAPRRPRPVRIDPPRLPPPTLIPPPEPPRPRPPGPSL